MDLLGSCGTQVRRQNRALELGRLSLHLEIATSFVSALLFQYIANQYSSLPSLAAIMYIS